MEDLLPENHGHHVTYFFAETKQSTKMASKVDDDDVSSQLPSILQFEAQKCHHPEVICKNSFLHNKSTRAAKNQFRETKAICKVLRLRLIRKLVIP